MHKQQVDYQALPYPTLRRWTAAAGCIMVGWMTIEVALIGLGSWLQPTYFVVGLLMIGLAVLLQRAESRHAEQQTALTGRQRQHAKHVTA